MATTYIKVIFGYHYNQIGDLTSALTTKYRTYGTNLNDGTNYPKTYQFNPTNPSNSTNDEAYTQFIKDMAIQAYEYYEALTYGGLDYGIASASATPTAPSNSTTSAQDTTTFNTINGCTFTPKYKMDGKNDIFAGVEIKKISTSANFNDTESAISSNNLLQYTTYHLSTEQLTHLKEIARYLGKSEKPQFYIFVQTEN